MDEVRVDGSELRLLREDAHLTQGQLAVKSGIGQSHISRLERGERPNAKVQTVVALANALGVPIDRLLAGKHQPRPAPRLHSGPLYELLDATDPMSSFGIRAEGGEIPIEDQLLIVDIIKPVLQRREEERQRRREERAKRRKDKEDKAS